MNEITKPTEGVRVELGGKEYTLRYTLAACKAAKVEFGGSILSLETLGKLDEDNVAKLFWYGLQEHHPEITVEQIEAMIEFRSLPYYMSKYYEAIKIALPDPKNEQSPTETRAKTTKPKGPRLIGSESGPSEDSTSVSAMASFGD